jgi:predicted chitinase
MSGQTHRQGATNAESRGDHCRGSAACVSESRAAFDLGEGGLAAFAITPLRLAHFPAQTLYETGGGTVLFESLAYGTGRCLLQILGLAMAQRPFVGIKSAICSSNQRHA